MGVQGFIYSGSGNDNNISCASLAFCDVTTIPIHGQYSVKRKPGLSFQLQKLLRAETKLPNLKLKTQPKLLLGYVLLDIALPVLFCLKSPKVVFTLWRKSL